MVEGAEPRGPSGFQTRIAEHGAAPLAPGDVVPAGISRDGHGWPRQGLIAAVLLAILLALYWGILRDLAWQWWDDESYSHGFLVPLFSAFLIWRRRRELRTLPARGSWLGFAVLLGGVAMLLLGDLGGENFLMRGSLVVVLAGLVLFHLGRQFFRALALPVLFLFFAVPLPATVFYAVAFPLQNLAARNASWALDLLRVPVLLDGNVIHLSQISLGVTEACSGIRSLMSLLAVAVALAALTPPGPWASAVLVASVFPIAVIANAFRVVATGLIGQYVRFDYAEGFFHSVSGWLVFLLAFACLLGVQRVIRLAQTHRWRRGP
jgi:exosortase